MNLIRRLSNPFRDSPTYGRDRATLISGLTIGIAGLILNTAILMTITPLMMDPNDPDFRMITENVEFGQLLSLILLGGATVLATILIPLRMLSVFWGPRIGGYFDQIVLSGISPFRFVIGKVTSQNLFLALILFLLLPYFVLCLTLGGIAPVYFLCGLFLVWLHCMMMALLTLWAALYMNELIAAAVVGYLVVVLGALGLAPIPVTAVPFTPMPALIYPLFSQVPDLAGMLPARYSSVFLSCAAGMGSLCLIALGAIYLGPLYGIVRDNSTFGEVVRPGDAKRKRWFRLRHHIQRPSELAFLYENRSARFRSFDGLLRWGGGLLGLLALAALANGVFGYIVVHFITPQASLQGSWWVYDVHTTNLVICGLSLVLAIMLFSHARNTMYQRLPFAFGRSASVTTLDLAFAGTFFLLTVGTAICLPWAYEIYIAEPNGLSVFSSEQLRGYGRPFDFQRIALEGPLVLLTSAVTIYALHHMLSQTVWMKLTAFLSTAGLYFFGFILVPLIAAFNYIEMPELRRWTILYDWLPVVAMTSPAAVLGSLFNELGRHFPPNPSSQPFYISHAIVLGLALLRIRSVRRQVKATYLTGPAAEAV